MFDYSALWQAPPEGLRLSGEAIHVWAVELDPAPEGVAKLEMLLSDDERTRARRFAFAHLQRRFIVGRAVLRLLLGKYLNTDAGRIAFGYGPNGKPYIAQGNAWLQFNLAHSDELALMAFSSHGALGVDLEKLYWQESLEDLAMRYFAPAECGLLRKAGIEIRRESFFSIWTMKEAILKASGIGLGVDLRDLDTSAVTGSALHHLGRSWYLARPPRIAGFASALAVEGGGEILSYFRWSSDEPWRSPPAR